MCKTSKTTRTMKYDERDGLLTVTEVLSKNRTQIAVYWIEEIPVAPGYGAGRGFEVKKHIQADGMGRYHVFVAAHGGRSSCDCRGHQSHGHCRHVDALAKLIALGKLPDPRGNGEQDAGPTETTEQIAPDLGMTEAEYRVRCGGRGADLDAF